MVVCVTVTVSPPFVGAAYCAVGDPEAPRTSVSRLPPGPGFKAREGTQEEPHNGGPLRKLGHRFGKGLWGPGAPAGLFQLDRGTPTDDNLELGFQTRAGGCNSPFASSFAFMHECGG